MSRRTDLLLDLQPRIRRLRDDIATASVATVQRPGFERLCAEYSDLASEVSNVLGRPFPARHPNGYDYLLDEVTVSAPALLSLGALVDDLSAAVDRAAAETSETDRHFRCLKAGGRPCQMHREINPRRFDLFFALPFRDPPTCKAANDALVQWLSANRAIPEERFFRADCWVTSGDFVCKICKAMQESLVVVADITAPNPNVFFELGLAVGMGKPIILLRDGAAPREHLPSDLLALEYVEYRGSAPEDHAWHEHFGIVFDGVRNRG